MLFAQGYYNTNEFTFTPLQHFEQQQKQQQQQSSVFPANNKDFVIEMQTYQQCPGCPTFSVPVPIPKFSADTFPVERKEEKTLFTRLADIVKPAIARAKEFFSVGDRAPVDQISSRIDTFRAGNTKLAAPLVASLAAVGFGLASMFGNNIGIQHKRVCSLKGICLSCRLWKKI